MRVSTPVTGAIVVPAVLTAAMASANERPKTYDARAFFMTTSYGAASTAGNAFHPAGDRVLVSSDATGVFNAVQIDLDTSEATSLTSSTTNAVFAVSYFPNDDRVLYTFDEAGNELNHLFVREQDGSTRDLTPGENVKASFGSWADDGESFLVITNERDAKVFDLYRYSGDGYERQVVFENDGG